MLLFIFGIVEEVTANGSFVQREIERFMNFTAASTIFRELTANHFHGRPVVDDFLDIYIQVNPGEELSSALDTSTRNVLNTPKLFPPEEGEV